jgi:putative transposase
MRQSTVLEQVLKLLPRRECEALSRKHHVGRPLRRTRHWDQFVALTTAQLSGHHSLREIDQCGRVHAQHLQTFQCRPMTRATLARHNRDQPWQIYRALFGVLLERCQRYNGQRKLPVDQKIVSIDSTTILLCLSLCPWASYQRKQGAIKVHVGLDHATWLPEFLTITEGCRSDRHFVEHVPLIPGTVYVFDRGYCDYAWFNRLTTNGCPFVTRVKKNMNYRVLQERPLEPGSAILADQVIRLNGNKGPRHRAPLRRIVLFDDVKQRTLVFMTNQLDWPATVIAAVYKERWQIELFFKWLKQNLKVKRFIGTSANAVMTQIWCALVTYLLLAFMKLSQKLAPGLLQLRRLIRACLFERRSLVEIAHGPPRPTAPISLSQLELALQ